MIESNSSNKSVPSPPRLKTINRESNSTMKTMKAEKHGLEIERRFFVQNGVHAPWKVEANSTSIQQFYLDAEELDVVDGVLFHGRDIPILALEGDEVNLFHAQEKWTYRIRYRNERTLLTLKGRRKGATALEMEWDIARNLGERLVATGHYAYVKKTRYTWAHTDGLIWEVDEFEEGLKGLILAEVELPSEEHPVAIPTWAVLELTGNGSWSNSSLAYTTNQLTNR